MKLPIFQLTWQPSNSKLGLTFPSEAKFNIQSFIFAIPIPVNYSINKRIEEQIEEQLRTNKYYFPVEVENKYVEIDGTFINWSFHFYFEQFTPFKFFINPYLRSPKTADEFSNSIYVYRGRYKGLNSFLFLPLIPADMTLLRSFFWQMKGIFVGFTPEFDESEFFSIISRG